MSIRQRRLDAVIHMGFPYNLASYRQQSGRAGRRERDSLSILIADGDNVLDQFYMHHPEDLLGENSLENAVIDLENSMIMEAHLQCAAAEIPMDLETDADYIGGRSNVEEVCRAHLLFDAKNNVCCLVLYADGYQGVCTYPT